MRNITQNQLGNYIRDTKMNIDKLMYVVSLLLVSSLSHAMETTVKAFNEETEKNYQVWEPYFKNEVLPEFRSLGIKYLEGLILDRVENLKINYVLFQNDVGYAQVKNTFRQVLKEHYLSIIGLIKRKSFTTEKDLHAFIEQLKIQKFDRTIAYEGFRVIDDTLLGLFHDYACCRHGLENSNQDLNKHVKEKLLTQHIQLRSDYFSDNSYYFELYLNRFIDDQFKKN